MWQYSRYVTWVGGNWPSWSSVLGFEVMMFCTMEFCFWRFTGWVLKIHICQPHHHCPTWRYQEPDRPRHQYSKICAWWCQVQGQNLVMWKTPLFERCDVSGTRSKITSVTILWLLIKKFRQVALARYRSVPDNALGFVWSHCLRLRLKLGNLKFYVCSTPSIHKKMTNFDNCIF